MQIRRGKYVLFEHPASADSWHLPEMEAFLRTSGMDWREADLCQYGLVTPGPAPLRVAMPAKKPTRFASNSWCVLEEACRRCSGEHRHQSLMGGRAAAAAEYTPELCEAFCRGLARQKRYDQQQMATSRRHGRSELKALIRRLTENVKRDATCAG